MFINCTPWPYTSDWLTQWNRKKIITLAHTEPKSHKHYIIGKRIRCKPKCTYWAKWNNTHPESLGSEPKPSHSYAYVHNITISATCEKNSCDGFVYFEFIWKLVQEKKTNLVLRVRPSAAAFPSPNIMLKTEWMGQSIPLSLIRWTNIWINVWCNIFLLLHHTLQVYVRVHKYICSVWMDCKWKAFLFRIYHFGESFFEFS